MFAAKVREIIKSSTKKCKVVHEHHLHDESYVRLAFLHKRNGSCYLLPVRAAITADIRGIEIVIYILYHDRLPTFNFRLSFGYDAEGDLIAISMRKAYRELAEYFLK